MLNKEYYKDKIIELASEGKFVAVRCNGEMCDCDEIIGCGDCKFVGRGSCDRYRKMWFDQEHEEVDWSKVEVDTKILVRSCESGVWFKRHFAEYKDGCVYAFDSGKTSWTNNNGAVRWEYAKLAEEN